MNVKQAPKKISMRHRARECALQALYAWYISKNTIEDVELSFIANQELKNVDVNYFRLLLKGTVEHIADIEAVLIPCLDRNLDELDPIERVILSLAVYELKYQLDVPYRVVINEAVEVAKTFGAEDGHKYINGVLDKIAPILSRK